MMEALRSSEMSVLTRATQRNMLEDGVLSIEINFMVFTPLKIKITYK
jgi:hypothetical protein